MSQNSKFEVGQEFATVNKVDGIPIELGTAIKVVVVDSKKDSYSIEYTHDGKTVEVTEKQFKRLIGL